MFFPLLPRNKKSDKTDFGHVLVVAGSRSMTGAALLTTRAALRSGSGLVTLAAPKSVTSMVCRALPESLLWALPETRLGSIATSAYKKLMEVVKKKPISVLAVGPGLSLNKETAGFVRRLVADVALPIVLDADGLNSFKGRAGLLRKRRSSLVLTPHKREFERLFSQKLPDRQPERLRLAKKLCKFYDVVLVLKGHPTLIASSNKVVVNKTGNPGMAKGGSGDVLTGMIAAFIAQGLGLFEAARWAVYFHGKASDLAVKKKSELGLLASDIIDYLPSAFR